MAQRDRAAGRAPARAGRGSAGRGPLPSGGSDLAAHRTRLRAVITPVVTEAGLDLDDLVVSRAGRRHLLRVIVDGDAGVSLDAIADVSRAISAALDAAEEAGGAFTGAEYVLEVSSPGVDRPLTMPRHWRRNIGRLVSVRVQEKQVTGRITAADQEQVTLDVAGRSLEVGYRDLGPGRIQIEFSRLDEISDDDLEEFTDDASDDGTDADDGEADDYHADDDYDADDDGAADGDDPTDADDREEDEE